MSMLAVAALMLCASAPPAIAPGGSEGFFVSPTGSDSNSGTSSASPFKTPFAAQQAVRAALRGHPKPSHISVTLAAGIYHLERPLNLTLADSSPGTTITYKAAASAGRGGSGGSVAPVTLSGGAPVTFVKADAAGLWKADVSALPSQAVAYGRQFYVNDRRAQRSREPGSYQCEKTATSPCARQKTLWGDAAWRITNTSVHIVGPLAAARARSWPNGGAGVELVWSGVGNAAWAESRCPVEAVTSGVASPAADDGAVQVKVSPMCLSCWANFKSQWEHHKIAPPTAIEAIGKDLLQPGQWWLDHEQKQIWYKPLPGETISSTTAMLPVLQKLLSGSGSGAAKISDITFSGISFQYATWHAEEGFVENQSGQGACAGFFGPVTPDTLDQRLPANVEFFRAERITFDRCEFAHLGANALDFAHGAHGNVVQDCLFRDVSAAAVQIGRTDGATAALQDASQQDIGNVVRNSIVRSPAVEFHGSVGLSVGYTIGTNLSHNEISNCTYGPISVGWGWGAHSYAANNTILANSAHSYKMLLNDGGCIYTLSPQPGNLIERNWCHDQGTPSSGALYPDEGSALMTWRENVVSNIGASEWAHIWTSTIRDILFADNFHDTAKIDNKGVNITMSGNVLVNSHDFPAAAKAIIAAAGPINSSWLR